MEEKYDRFGKQWEAYLMKKSKAEIVKRYRDACVKLQQVNSVDLADVVVPEGTLCVACENKKAGYGYDLHFCKECWEEEKA